MISSSYIQIHLLSLFRLRLPLHSFVMLTHTPHTTKTLIPFFALSYIRPAPWWVATSWLRLCRSSWLYLQLRALKRAYEKVFQLPFHADNSLHRLSIPTFGEYVKKTVHNFPSCVPSHVNIDRYQNPVDDINCVLARCYHRHCAYHCTRFCTP